MVLLVVDTNVLMTYFWKNSVFKRFLSNIELDLVSPEYSLVEINKYKSDILKKTGISSKEFDELKKEIALHINFISIDKYKASFKTTLISFSKLSEYDKSELIKDIDFLALASTFKCGIWSNDKLLKKQSLVQVYDTGEIIKLFDP